MIYLDHAATTPVDPEVVSAMEPWMNERYGNPSSSYSFGHDARKALDDARASVARLLGCAAQEVVFTAGGTESDNMALFGIMRQHPGAHIVTSAIEHPAVRDVCTALEAEGYGVTRVGVDSNGLVQVEDVLAAITPKTVMVSIMLVNNEIGTIQPVGEIAAAVHEQYPHVMVHTDACQATGFMEVDLKVLGVDLYTINASKVYGPKGVGALFVRKGVRLKPLMYGGGQERGLRPGTENVAGIVGFARALELAYERRAQDVMAIAQLQEQLLNGLLALDGVSLNGERIQRVANNVNVSIAGVDGESLLFALDQEGIMASLGSACAAGSHDPSYVIMALGRSKEEARCSMRFTLGRGNTAEEVTRMLEVITELVPRLRSRS